MHNQVILKLKKINNTSKINMSLYLILNTTVLIIWQHSPSEIHYIYLYITCDTLKLGPMPLSI